MRVLPISLLLLAAAACGPSETPIPTRQSECVSPDGRWIAATYIIGWGGATGAAVLYVSLRPSTDTLAHGRGDVLAMRHGHVERLAWHPSSARLLVSLDTSVVVEDFERGWTHGSARVAVDTVRSAIPAERRWKPAACAVGAT